MEMSLNISNIFTKNDYLQMLSLNHRLKEIKSVVLILLMQRLRDLKLKSTNLKLHFKTYLKQKVIIF